MDNKFSNLKRRKALVCLLLLLSPANSFRSNGDIFNASESQNILRNDVDMFNNVSQIDDDFANEHLKPQNESIGLAFMLFAVSILLTSTILFRIIWSYLNNVSTAKKCFLLYLYQDIIELAILASWFWFGIVMDC